MKVIILAAGIGKRLGISCENKPKCLLEFGGISLLQRHLKILMNFTIDEVIIICGFQKQLIDAEIKQIQTKIPVTTIYNPDYTLGSVVSFWCTREILNSGNDIILMDADVLYDPRILQSLIETQYKNCFLLDRNFDPGDEPVKLCIRDGQLIDFRKQIDKDLDFEYQGESVGFFRFSSEITVKLAKQAQHYIDHSKQEEPYEEVIRDLLLLEKEAFAFEDITGIPWIEIDFPEDIDRAENLIVNNLASLQLQN